MPGLELPLIGPPSGGDVQPQPVVRPQGQAFQHIAAAGENLQHEAVNLWYMQRMARRDEEEAQLTNASTAMQTASLQTRQEALNHPDLTPDQMPAFYSQEFTKRVQPTLSQFPDNGPLHDRVMAMFNGERDLGGAKMAYQATAESLVRANQTFKATLKSTAANVAMLDPADQPKAIAAGAALIDNYVANNHLPKEVGDQIHQQFQGEIELGHLQKSMMDSPGSVLMELQSPDFEKKYPNFAAVGGEAKRLQLAQTAHSAVALQQKLQDDGPYLQKRHDFIEQLNGYGGKPVPTAVLQQGVNQGLITPTRAKFYSPGFEPEHRVEPPLMDWAMGEANSIKTPEDAAAFKARIDGMPEFHLPGTSGDRAKLFTTLDSNVKEAQTDVGKAREQANGVVRGLMHDPLSFPRLYSKQLDALEGVYQSRVKYARTPDEIHSALTDFQKSVTDLTKPKPKVGEAPVATPTPAVNVADFAAKVRSGAIAP